MLPVRLVRQAHPDQEFPQGFLVAARDQAVAKLGSVARRSEADVHVVVVEVVPAMSLVGDLVGQLVCAGTGATCAGPGTRSR